MTSRARPGPDNRQDLIAQASIPDADSLAGRGKLRVYLGIAPGVGKTYAMLRDARARRRAGTDTVVAQWERHGRRGTAAQLDNLEVLPPRTVTYREADFAELDTRAVLDRRPELAVLDELPHANLPGELHAKRWQDVEDLLASGIDVYTTLNVANIESLSQPVAKITGVHPAEPVPDAFLRVGACQLVIGSRRRSRWSRLLTGSTVADQVLRAAGDLPVQIVNVGRPDKASQEWRHKQVPPVGTAEPETARNRGA